MESPEPAPRVCQLFPITLLTDHAQSTLFALLPLRCARPVATRPTRSQDTHDAGARSVRFDG